MTRIAIDPSCEGVMDVINKTLADEGILGFYRGFFVSVLGVVVYRAMYFGFYDSIKVCQISAFEINKRGSFLVGILALHSGSVLELDGQSQLQLDGSRILSILYVED